MTKVYRVLETFPYPWETREIAPNSNGKVRYVTLSEEDAKPLLASKKIALLSAPQGNFSPDLKQNAPTLVQQSPQENKPPVAPNKIIGVPGEQNPVPPTTSPYSGMSTSTSPTDAAKPSVEEAHAKQLADQEAAKKAALAKGK